MEEVAADIDALVARDAAERFEQLIAGQLLRRDRGGVAREPAVEPATRRDQGALVGRNRIQEGSDVGLPPVRIAEMPYRFGVGAQLAHDFIRTRRHNLGIAKRLLGMIFERAEIPFPVQAKIQACTEYRRGVERERPPIGR